MAHKSPTKTQTKGLTELFLPMYIKHVPRPSYSYESGKSYSPHTNEWKWLLRQKLIPRYKGEIEWTYLISKRTISMDGHDQYLRCLYDFQTLRFSSTLWQTELSVLQVAQYMQLIVSCSLINRTLSSVHKRYIPLGRKSMVWEEHSLVYFPNLHLDRFLANRP